MTNNGCCTSVLGFNSRAMYLFVLSRTVYSGQSSMFCIALFGLVFELDCSVPFSQNVLTVQITIYWKLSQTALEQSGLQFDVIRHYIFLQICCCAVPYKTFFKSLLFQIDAAFHVLETSQDYTDHCNLWFNVGEYDPEVQVLSMLLFYRITYPLQNHFPGRCYRL